MSTFQYLFSPLQIGDLWVKNRILSTGHMTTYVQHGLPTEQLIAYHHERAKGGAGLIVVEANAIHPTAYFTANTIMAFQDEIIPYYKKLAEAVHPYGTKMFVQLFHPGREILPSGTSVAVAPSAVPADRFSVMPRELGNDEIKDIIKGYAETAERVQKGGLDGVEIVASHGYLISQFLSPRTNLRTDEYGGSFENRLRFLKEVIEAVRQKTGANFVVGLRISVDEYHEEGLMFNEVQQTLAYIDQEIGLDYFSLVAGSSATHASSVFTVPPAPIPPATLAPYAGVMRKMLSVPVFVTSRINDVSIAEKVLADGQADMVGMTRAMICDPHMANKAVRGEIDRIRLCIGCNQACIGHMQSDLPISCLQNPVTGRELHYAQLKQAPQRKKIVVVGGGPAGMKAAVIAAQRGHQVILLEKSGELGGQVRLARKIPGREEFGELIPNLTRELDYYRVQVHLDSEATAASILALKPDEVILATGSTPYFPKVEGINLPHVSTAWDILERKKQAGKRVVIADWRGDMPGVGLALYLKEQGCDVELVTNAYQIGHYIEQKVRETILTQLYLKKINMTVHHKLFKVEQGSVLFKNMYTGEPKIFTDIDTLVLATGYIQQDALYHELKASLTPVHRIGDCLAPRTVEEAILEGLETAANL